MLKYIIFSCLLSFPLSTAFPSAEVCKAPNALDLTATKPFPPVYNQGGLVHGAEQAIAAVFSYNHLNGLTQDSVEGNNSISRLALHFDSHINVSSSAEDDRMMITHAMNVVINKGVCDERFWPYDTAQVTTTPPEACQKDAENHKSIGHRKLNSNDLDDIRCTLKENYPVIFAIKLYSNLQEVIASGNTTVDIPTSTDIPMSSHGMVIVGFDDERQVFKVRSSWGRDMGDGGHFYFTYAYINSPVLSYDFWAIYRVKNNDMFETNSASGLDPASFFILGAVLLAMFI